MSKDYYHILEIEPSATELEIIDAYRRLSQLWHPQKNPNSMTKALHIFHELAEAYEVLSSDKLRFLYDQYQEFGLKQGRYHQEMGFIGGYKYSGNAFEIFEKFFGTSNPFYANYTGIAIRVLENHQNEQELGPPQNLVLQVPCSLDELYNGCEKYINYTHKKYPNNGGILIDAHEEKRIEIRRGFNSETKLVFQGEGNQHPKYPPSDLIIEIIELEHEFYSRVGQDLYYQAQVTLADALLCNPIQIQTLDGRNLSIQCDQIIDANTRKIVPNEGMPIPKDNEFSDELTRYGFDMKSPEKGNLIIAFTINFPTYIPYKSISSLKKVMNSQKSVLDDSWMALLKESTQQNAFQQQNKFINQIVKQFISLCTFIQQQHFQAFLLFLQSPYSKLGYLLFESIIDQRNSLTNLAIS